MSVNLDSSKCVGCGLCVEVCPTHALFTSRGVTQYNAAKCNFCGTCDRICICSALTFVK